ncbi:hypothetical protein BC628DRAFT_665048 [Trametes gibbosa]|nr:hypothetical protein BC628DRAFT_665048 [Trametes gibbosa]
MLRHWPPSMTRMYEPRRFPAMTLRILLPGGATFPRRSFCPSPPSRLFDFDLLSGMSTAANHLDIDRFEPSRRYSAMVSCYGCMTGCLDIRTKSSGHHASSSLTPRQECVANEFHPERTPFKSTATMRGSPSPDVSTGLRELLVLTRRRQRSIQVRLRRGITDGPIASQLSTALIPHCRVCSPVPRDKRPVRDVLFSSSSTQQL